MAGVNEELTAITARHAAIVLKIYCFISQTLHIATMQVHVLETTECSEEGGWYMACHAYKY